MSATGTVEVEKPAPAEEPKEKQRRPGPRPVPCPWCDQTKCNHCRCLGHASCNHKPGEMCPNERYKRRLVCNPCEKNKLRKQKEAGQQESQNRNIIYNNPYNYQYFVNPINLPYTYNPQQYSTFPVPYQTYILPDEHQNHAPKAAGYTEANSTSGVKRSTSKTHIAPVSGSTPTDESIPIYQINSENPLGVIMVNPDTKLLDYVRKYIYVHFIEDLHKKDFSFIQSSGESIPTEKESSTLCSQVLQTREKKHHTFKTSQTQKALYIKSENTEVSKEAIEEATKFFERNADKRVKLESTEPQTLVTSPEAAAPAQKPLAITPSNPQGAIPDPNPQIVRNPSYTYNPHMASPYYPASVYYVPQGTNRYVVSNYGNGSIPTALSYSSLPGNLSGSYNSLTNIFNRYNKTNISYTSMDYLDTATAVNSYLPDNEINVLENTTTVQSKPETEVEAPKSKSTKHASGSKTVTPVTKAGNTNTEAVGGTEQSP